MERALALDALSRDHAGYPFFLTVGHRHDEAIAAARAAVDHESLSASASHTPAVQFALAGRLEDAIAECRRTIELDPEFSVAREVLATTLVSLGRTTEALAPARRAVDLSPRNLLSLAVLGHVLGRLGERGESRDVLARLDEAAAGGRYVPSHAYALVHTGLGQVDEAFAWLDKSYEERFNRLAYLRFERVWQPLHHDPRWEALLSRIGLPPRP